MGWNTFGRSNLVAAAAGCGVMPWLLLAMPLLGGRAALAFYLVAVTAVYVTAIAPSLRRGLGAGVCVGILGTVFALLSPALPELALALATLLALARSGFLYQEAPARAVVIEAGLVAGGLVFARFLAGSSVVSMMLALWGFLLVQGVFFLVGGVRPRASEPHADPFDVAHARATALLDGLAL